MAFKESALQHVLGEWAGVVGDDVTIHVGDDDVRELWPVDTSHGGRYYLKRLGPWRNLPILNEYRMLAHLLQEGVRVPLFLLTDSGAITGGAEEDSFVLIRALANESLTPLKVVASEDKVGRATAHLHEAMAAYPQKLDSYKEDVAGNLTGDLRLPEGLARAFSAERDRAIARITVLPLQTVHGDFTPDNVLRLASGDVTGFIDFDHLPQAPRIWDIAKYLSRRIRFRWTRDTPELDRTACIEGFVSGYSSVSQLQHIELEALPSAILAYNVMEATYDQSILDGTLERRILPDHAETLADTLRTIEWQLSSPESVESAVERAL